MRWIPVLLMPLLSLAAYAQAFLPGDLDGDGRVTPADATLLNDYLWGRRSLSDRQISAADVDNDGRITEADEQQLRRSSAAVAAGNNSQVALDSAYSGQVVDRATGQPLSNVEVTVPGAGISTRTDSQGRFQLPQNAPNDQILVAKLDNYLPYSYVGDQSQPLQVRLERQDPNTSLVLQTDVVHLGDDQYSPDSAGASQFRLRTQGIELTRTFELNRIPSSMPILRIGSLIGLDTPEAMRAGQTRIAEADMTPLSLLLNGTLVQTIALSGNDITVPLPLSALQLGSNTVVLRTGKTMHPSFGGSGIQIPLLGGVIRLGIPVGGGGIPDFDDIELANIVVELPRN